MTVYVNTLNEETQNKIASMVAGALQVEYDLQGEELTTLVNEALESRVSDLFDTVDKKVLLAIINK